VKELVPEKRDRSKRDTYDIISMKANPALERGTSQMSVYKTYSKNDLEQPDFAKEFRICREDHPCFYCGEDLNADPAIEWLGQKAQIFLHAECAIEFTLRMFRDVHQWETKTGKLVTSGPIK
jgi:hypothetical protein